MQVDLFLFGDAIALRGMDVCSKYSTDARGVFRKSRLELFGMPKWVQVCGEMECGRIFAGNVPVSGVGAQPWSLKRRNGLARGTYDEPAADDRFPGGQMLTAVQYCVITQPSAGGYSANQLAVGLIPADLYTWGMMAMVSCWVRPPLRRISLPSSGSCA